MLISVIEMTLTLLQLQASMLCAPPISLLIRSQAAHSGVYGLTRSVRVEALLPVSSLETPVTSLPLVFEEPRSRSILKAL